MALECTPIMPTFGAVVRGADVSALDDALFAEILDAFHVHGLLVFPQQTLTPEHEVAFARRFPHGEGMPNYTEHTLPGIPEVQRLGNAESDGKPIALLNKIGIEWHTDGTSRQRPCVATQLYCIEAPQKGGETLFASACAAYDLLPEATKARINGMKVRYNYKNIVSKVNAASGGAMVERALREWDDVVHPLVRTHPVTGRRALWVTPAEMVTIDGMEPEESLAFVEELMAPGTTDEHVYAHTYRPGDLVVWDNRSMLHSTTPYIFHGQTRLLHRVALNGNEIPV